MVGVRAIIYFSGWTGWCNRP